MKNNVTELVFILDRSGSMAGLESDTIGGFNALIEKQRKQDGKCYVSTVLFDNVAEVLHDRLPIHPSPQASVCFPSISQALCLKSCRFWELTIHFYQK